MVCKKLYFAQYFFMFAAGLITATTMDIIPILLGVAAVLLVYQLVFRRDNDGLDNRGRPKKR